MHMSRLARNARGDHGFTMVTVLLAMMVLSLLSVGAYAASLGDLPVARKDQDRKRAYEAAQAGVDWYLSLLRANPDFWEKCAAGGPKAGLPLSLEGQGSGGHWITADATAPEAKFRVELMNGTKQGGAGGTPCDPNNADITAKDVKGQVWIRSTGVAGNKVRSVLAALQPNSDFLKYVLFTNWESQDPQLANAAVNWQPDPAPNGTIGGNVSQCDYPGLTRDRGPYNTNLGLPVCVVTSYGPDDKLLGPVHTNDDGMRMCGAQVGRTSQDNFEIASAPSATNWNSRSDVRTYSDALLWLHYYCLGFPNPTPVATVKAPAPVLQLPPSNVRLLKLVQDLGGQALVLQGQTCVDFLADGRLQIVKNGEHAVWGTGAGTKTDPKDVECDPLPGVTPEITNPPASGLIYVKNATGQSCTPRVGHNSTTSYSSSPGCGDLAVKGTYGKSVTIAAENDIIITGDLTRANDLSMLGLIGNGFIRIRRPMTEDPFRVANQEAEQESYGDEYLWCGLAWYQGPTGDCNKQFILFGDWFKKNPSWGPATSPCKAISGSAGRMDAVDPSVFTPVQKVQAAIISMRHTLIVDNLMCPPQFGNGIEFEGSIATYWAVQLWACTVNNYCAGYPTRTWKYDDRLKTQQPPHFIAPLNSDGRWTISRRTEQVPTPVGTT